MDQNSITSSTCENENQQVKHIRGYGLRGLLMGFLLDGAISFTIISMFFLLCGGYLEEGLLFLAIGIVFSIFTVLQFFSVSKGRKFKSWNTVSIVLGAIFAPVLYGIFGIVGGIRGKKAISNPELDKLNTSNGQKQRKKLAISMLIIAIILFALCVIMFCLGLLDDYYANDSEDFITTGWILLSIGIFFVILTTLCFISAKKGKTNRNWNNFSIMMGLISSVFIFGIFGIVGGMLGNDLLPKKPRKVKEKRVKTDGTQELNSQLLKEGVVAIEEKTPEEYIQPKMSLKGKKAIMWTIVASYSLFLIVGVFLTAIPAMAKMISGMGICEEENARAYGITIGVMWLALVPTIGYFFATISPYELSKKNKIILSSITTALLVITNIVFFVIINVVKIDGVAIKKFFEGSDSWFVPLSMVFGSVATMICYALTLFKLNPQKIKTKKPTLAEGHKILDSIVYFFKLIGYGVLSLTKKLLAFKEKQPEIFILIATILLTWLSFFTSFIFAIICIAIMTTVALMYFFGVITLLQIDEKNFQPIVNAEDVLPSAKEYTYTDSQGYIQTIYSENKKDFYDAGGHYVASSHDDGKTIEFTSTRVTEEKQEDEE